VALDERLPELFERPGLFPRMDKVCASCCSPVGFPFWWKAIRLRRGSHSKEEGTRITAPADNATSDAGASLPNAAAALAAASQPCEMPGRGNYVSDKDIFALSYVQHPLSAKRVLYADSQFYRACTDKSREGRRTASFDRLS
jgi:hypothetical protein